MQPNMQFCGLFWLGKESLKEVTFQVWREHGVFSLVWVLDQLKNVSVGILSVASGPREWSPRRTIPEDFTPLFRVCPEDRLCAFISGGMEYLKGWRIHSEGHVGFFPADSESLVAIRTPGDLVFGV
jgi:hypothetical protein